MKNLFFFFCQKFVDNSLLMTKEAELHHGIFSFPIYFLYFAAARYKETI